jgi:hypothetical protein
MQNKKRSPEYIATLLLFCSFIIAMVIFALFRVIGVAWFSQDYVTMQVSPLADRLIMSAYHVIEGFLILKILTKQKWWVCLLCALCYTGVQQFNLNMYITFALDIAYTFVMPFIFNKDKDKSILMSTLFFVGIIGYQYLMMFGRYDLVMVGKYDVVWQILSTIDYKFFLIVILLFKTMKSIKRGKS